jgi:hypothetical protein
MGPREEKPDDALPAAQTFRWAVDGYWEDELMPQAVAVEEPDSGAELLIRPDRPAMSKSDF